MSLNRIPKMNNAVTQLQFVRNFLRLAWFAGGAVLLFLIAARNLPPSGVLAASARTGEPSGFVDGFTPLDRARPTQDGGLWYSDIVHEPVYFHVAAPRLYDTARVTLRYRNEGQPYLALGARTDLDAWSFGLVPIDLPMLDESGWASRQDGDLRVYERKATTRSAEEILGQSAGGVAVLAIDPARWGLRLPKAGEKPFETSLELVGPRSIYVYVQEAPFELSLGFRGPADAEGKVVLERDGKILLQRRIAGDGAVDLALSGIEPGLYRVVIAAPESVTLSGLRSRHDRVALVDPPSPGGSGGAGAERFLFPPGSTRYEPEFPVFTWEADPATSPYDAIVARYAPPSIDADGWRTASASFDLRSVASSQGRVQMIVSAPKIRDRGAKIRVDRVDVEYVRPPFDPKKLLDLFKLDL